MSNFSENLAIIVKNIGCDYQRIDKSYSGQQITELYLKEYEKGRKYGYTPVILSCDDSLAEILEINKKFIDFNRMNVYFMGYEMINANILNSEFTGKEHNLSPVELEQIKYWQPSSIGNIIYNEWD